MKNGVVKLPAKLTIFFFCAVGSLLWIFRTRPCPLLWVSANKLFCESLLNVRKTQEREREWVRGWKDAENCNYCQLQSVIGWIRINIALLSWLRPDYFRRCVYHWIGVKWSHTHTRMFQRVEQKTHARTPLKWADGKKLPLCCFGSFCV